jgi:hypothetical protein
MTCQKTKHMPDGRSVRCGRKGRLVRQGALRVCARCAGTDPKTLRQEREDRAQAIREQGRREGLRPVEIRARLRAEGLL